MCRCTALLLAVIAATPAAAQTKPTEPDLSAARAALK